MQLTKLVRTHQSYLHHFIKYQFLVLRTCKVGINIIRMVGVFSLFFIMRPWTPRERYRTTNLTLVQLINCWWLPLLLGLTPRICWSICTNIIIDSICCRILISRCCIIWGVRASSTIFLMYATVPFKSKTVRESDITDVTTMGFFSCVDFGVILEMRSLVKCWTANITPVWFLTCMYPPVVPKCRMSCKCLIADFALVGSLTWVDPFMVFKVRTLRELHRTDRAFIRFFTCMDPWMVL